jgi:hypothetical protein
MKKSRIVVILIIIHFVLVFFQIQFKSMILDTTFWRDLLLIPLSVASFFLILKGYVIDNSLDVMMILLVLYGVIHIMMIDYGFIEDFRVFRVYFMPYMLYFIAKRYIVSKENVMLVTNVLFAVFVVYLLDVYFEYFLNYFGISQFDIPWYKFTFRTSYRYIGNVSSGNDAGYIMPGEAGVLGFQGWEHASAAVTVVLFAYSLPFIHIKGINKYKRYGNVLPKARYLNYFLFAVLVLCALLIYNVTMPLFQYCIIMILFALYDINNRKVRYINKRVIIAAVIILIIMIALYYGRDSELFQRHYGNIFGHRKQKDETSTLSTIVDSSIIYFIFGLDIKGFLFGLGDKVNMLKYVVTENRLLYYGVQFGMIWMFMFIGIIFTSLRLARKVMRMIQEDQIYSYEVFGIALVVVACSMDMLHYARVMMFPLIDMYSILLGMLSGVYRMKKIFLNSAQNKNLY